MSRPLLLDASTVTRFWRYVDRRDPDDRRSVGRVLKRGADV